MNWKNKWKKELNSVVPKLSDTVLNTPTEKVEIKSERVKSRRRFISFGALSFAAVLVLTLVIGFYLLQPPTVPETVFAVEINPAAAFVLDKNDKIKSVTAINSDADVILSSEENLNEIIGKSANQAVEKFVDIAAKYGYIDLSDFAAVRITSCGAKNFESLRASVESFLSGKGIPSVVFTPKVEEIEFCDIIGIEKEQGVKLVDTVKNSPVLYAERAAVEKELDELKKEYENYIGNLINDLDGEFSSINTYLEEQLGLIDNIISNEDYLNVIKEVKEIEKKIRELKHGFDYNIPRPPISQDELVNKRDEILDGFDNENDFWNNRKNNGKK
ncbi:MAG: hypothetical protein IJX03_02890 [Clostridia bacterium]|nr:hypothetical protein [Clostridia bacterium]